LTSEYRKLKARHETLITQHEHLKMGHEELKDLYTKTDSRARALETLHQDGTQEGYIKDLQARIEENDNLIATQEQQLEDYRISKEKQERELNSLRPYAVRVRELDDECKMLKSENDSLAKKANMVDHFQRKLESLNATERENTSLRQRIDTLQDNLKDYDKVYLENEKLKNTLPEYEKKFSDYEMEATNLNAMCSMYKNNLRTKEVEIETLNARQASDERFIQELQETIRAGNPATFSPNSPAGGSGNLTLEEELAQAPDPTPNYLLEISRLQAENQLLKSGSAGTTNATLRVDLEESERKCQRLAENLRNLTEQQAVTQKQLEAVLKTSTNEKYVQAVDNAMKAGPFKMLTEEFYRDSAIASTRDLERKAAEELKVAKAKLADAQSELTSQYRDLLAAKADCTLNPHVYVSYWN
jgi:protein HOOK3